MSEQFLSASYARILFRHLRLTKATGDRFFRGSGVTYDQLMAMDSGLSFEQQACLFENALTISKRPDLGLTVGAQLHLSSHGRLGVAAFSSANLGQALEMFFRFSDLRAQIVEFVPVNEGAVFRLQLHESVQYGVLRYFLVETIISSIHAAITFFSGGSDVRGSIRFAYPAPAYANRYREAFKFPVYFDQPVTEITIDRDALNIPSPVADEALHREAVEHCEQLLSALGKNSETHADKVRSLIHGNPGKLWSIDEIAKQLHMSSRTLMRKLKSENLKFQIIRDEVLKEQAKSYLTDTSLTVESVGHLLGFGDVSSFRRSFKRWFGETPSHYRQRAESE